MSMFKDDEDAIFGDELFKATVKNKEEYPSYLKKYGNPFHQAKIN